DDNDDDNNDNSKDDDEQADSDDDGNSDADDNERTDSDDDENPSFTLKDYDKEEHDEEYESDDDYENTFEEEDDDDLYKDVDMRSLGTEHEKERQGDEEMNDADQNVSQELPYEQVVDDAHVTLTTSQKTDDLKQSSSVLFDFARKFLILENVPPVVDEVASMMHVKSRQEKSSTQAPSLFTVPVTAVPETATAHATIVSPTISMITPPPQLTIPSLHQQPFQLQPQSLHFLISLPCLILPKEVSNFATPVIQSTITESLENVVLAKSSSQPQSTYEAAASLTEFELNKILIEKLEKSKSCRAAEEHRNLYNALIKSYQLEKDLFDSYGKAYSLMRSCDDKDKDQDPLAGSDQGLKKKKTRKDPKSSGKSVQAEEPVFETADTETPQDQRGLAFNLLKGTFKSFVELEYHFEECYKAVTDQLDWNNPTGHEYPFDLSKPLLLIEAQGRQVVPADYLFNNDLEYLKVRSSSRKYTTSTTKTKAARYDNIEGIEDMVSEL
ncbi:hypothetical protein Tco_0738038, partial [Tanacetum coccineum]